MNAYTFLSVKEEKIYSIIEKYGGNDGAHHKQWALDQVMRVVLGRKYKKWVKDTIKAGYDWDEGIAPKLVMIGMKEWRHKILEE